MLPTHLHLFPKAAVNLIAATLAHTFQITSKCLNLENIYFCMLLDSHIFKASCYPWLNTRFLNVRV